MNAAPQIRVVLVGSAGKDDPPSPSYDVKRVEVDGLQLPGVERAIVIAHMDDFARVVVTLSGEITVVSEADDEDPA